jgi:beta-barrel assembly-enhancing protease
MERAMRINSRRSFLRAGLCGCALTAVGAEAWGRILPTEFASLVTQDYQPVNPDERGLWQSCERFEEALATSKRRIDDPRLTRYLTSIVLSLTEGLTTSVRVYPMWESDFNASMFPNGLMIVNSGFLARMRNEAQLAAVLGHECGHFLRQHSLKSMRSRRTKTSIAAFVGAGANVATGITGDNWYDLADSINQNLLLSVFQFSRELESEADAYGLKLLTQRGYSPEAAAQVWSQLIEEQKASAAARKKRYKVQRSAFNTHPPPEDRLRDLTQTAERYRSNAGSIADYDERRDSYLEATRELRPRLLEEQVKLNDPGASLYLINSLAKDGWDGVLRYYEGEVYRMRGEFGDDGRATAAYAASIELPSVPPQAHRAHGYALLKSGAHERGKQQLRRYLELVPDASDSPMIQFTLNQ